MRDHDGIAHTSVLRAAVFSEHQVRRAVAEGRLSRVRRSWVIAPWCDDRLRAAATASGRVTCISAAEMRGWWTPGHEEVHIAVRPTASRFDVSGLRAHWASGPAPVTPYSTDEPVLNVLFHVARCLTPDDALAVWESALKNGSVQPEVLARVDWRSADAERLAQQAGCLSDSGVESRFVALMRTAGIRVRQQVWVDGHPLDGLIGAALGIQIDGFAHHSSAADRRRDLRADARLALRGFTVLRFDYQQVMFDPAYVVDTVRTAMSQGLHLRR